MKMRQRKGRKAPKEGRVRCKDWAMRFVVAPPKLWIDVGFRLAFGRSAAWLWSADRSWNRCHCSVAVRTSFHCVVDYVQIKIKLMSLTRC